jgi:hypothetical protein
MGVPDATVVGDHDEERAGLPPDGLGPLLDQTVRVAVHDRLGDPGIGRHGLGHPQRLLLEGAVELMAQARSDSPRPTSRVITRMVSCSQRIWVDSRRCRTTPPSPRRRPYREHNAHNPVNAGFEDYEDNRDGLVAAV